jgi:hypothetical protein
VTVEVPTQLELHFRTSSKEIYILDTFHMKLNRYLLCKNGPLVGLCVEIVGRDGNCLFRGFRPFTALYIIQNVQLRINTRESYKMYEYIRKIDKRMPNQ